MVRKGSGSDVRVAQQIQRFVPSIEALEGVWDEVYAVVGTTLKAIADTRAFLDTSDNPIPELLVGASRRRIAATMDLNLIRAEEALRAWEQYILPPLGDDLLLGDILREKGEPADSAEAHQIVVTPSCDLVRRHGNAKVVEVLVSRCEPVGEWFQKISLPRNRAKACTELEKKLSEPVRAGCLCLPALPPRTHGPGLLPYWTVRDAVCHYPPIRAGETHPSIPNHRAAALSALNLERIQRVPPDGGDRRSWPPGLTLPCHRNGYEGHTDVYGRMWWDRPAPTLTTRCDSLSNGRYGHPQQHRAISLREAAALQSFPDDYIFYGGSKRSIALQIGNAVPVRLAETLGRHIVEMRRALRR